MSPDQSPFGEPVFVSADVARLAGISLRQLQWWDERKLVSPRQDDHRRIYTPQQVLEVLAVAALRRKGLSLQKIRKVLRLLQRELRLPTNDMSRTRLYLLTDGDSIFLDHQLEIVLGRLTDATKPMYLLSLSDQMKRVTSETAPRSYRTSQLPLFGHATSAKGRRAKRTGRQRPG
jgi:DNA-binding transcriptional MerR regulator